MSDSKSFGRAIVTGASSGLGAEISRILLKNGCEVWGTSRDPSRISVPGVRALKLDLSNAGDVGAFAGKQIPAISPDLLVNNAGYGIFGKLEQQDAADIRAQLDIMLGAPALLCAAALGEMKAAKRGCIVNVSSLAALFQLPDMAPYNCAKAGISALSRTLMEEARAEGITVIDFQPGDFRSGFFGATRRVGGSDGAWDAAEAHLAGAPDAAAIARKLYRRMTGGKSGTFRAGIFLQTGVGPLVQRLLPERMFRAILRTYLD